MLEIFIKLGWRVVCRWSSVTVSVRTKHDCVETTNLWKPVIISWTQGCKGPFKYYFSMFLAFFRPTHPPTSAYVNGSVNQQKLPLSDPTHWRYIWMVPKATVLQMLNLGSSSAAKFLSFFCKGEIRSKSRYVFARLKPHSEPELEK